MKKIIIYSVLLSVLTLFSCESEMARKERLARMEQQRVELVEKKALEEKRNAIRIEKERIESERQQELTRIQTENRLAQEKKDKEIYNRYINNSLPTGTTPYSRYYGMNSSCDDYGCSQIRVVTSNSDVLVTIKKNDKVVRHAFIQSGDSYSFSFPDGTYQAFFYYGKGWNPEKEMKNGKLKGGFISDEVFGKDYPQTLNNNILEYQLILQQNGNFSTKPSNPEEAL